MRGIIAFHHRETRVTSGDRPADHPISDGAYYFLAALCGVATGVVGAAFHLVVDNLVTWPGWLVARFGNEWPTIALAAGIAAAGLVAAFFITRTFAQEAAGSGVQEIEGAMEGLREVRWRRILPVKFVGGVLALSSGLVAGREGPTIHMGASIAQAISERMGLTEAELRGLLAAGAAAGLAAAFNAPLAAILFVIEETRKQFRYTFRSYTAVIIASAASAIGMELVGGTAPPLRLDNAEMPLSLIPAFLVLGALLGALGIVFNSTLLFMLDWTAATFRRVPFVPALVVGAAAGALAIVLPQAVGGGELIIPGLVTGNLAVTTLLALGLIRFVGAVVSYPVGVPGGIFAPLLTIATVFGLLAAVLLNAIVPLPPLAAAAFAIAAMGGLFSATIRAPLVGVVLAAELTGGYALLLPLIVTCVTANAVAQALGGRPVYELLLERTLRLAGKAVPPPRVGVSAPVGADDEPRAK
jgi:CIC family chloride channel protein